MKVLVATGKQGKNDGDFCWTNDGEIVKFPVLECSNPRCGCDRSWVGIDSSKSTTTAKVVSLKMNVEKLGSLIYSSKAKDGWITDNANLKLKQTIMRNCRNDAKKLANIAKQYKVGTVVERKFNKHFPSPTN